MMFAQHPLSAAFPSMPEAEIEALAIDIETHGQREPGVLFEGMVLDGWHRYVACQKAKAKFKTVPFEGEDPVAFVLSKNLHRRHLTASQRAAAVVATSGWRGPGKAKQAAAAHLKTNGEMAKAAEVSERTIKHARAAHEAGLGEAVREGVVSAERAAQVAKLPKGKREKALRQPAPKKEKPQPDSKLRAELIDLQGKYADLLEKHSDLSDTARDLEDKLTKFETTDPDDQQKLIGTLQKRIVKLEAEVEHQKRRANDQAAKNNELIREVKRLRQRG